MKPIIQKIGMVVVVLLSFLSASAYDFEVDGIYYNIVSFDNLTCSVTSGDSKYVGDITIPDKVTLKGKTLSVISISDDAFFSCDGLTSIIIPNSVTKIGESVFYECTGLTSVIISNSVTEIGGNAFVGCTGLTSVVIPNSVTKIEAGTFFGCTGLTSVIIPNSVTEIGNMAFYKCTGLTTVAIPNSVTQIWDSAFFGCTGLTSVAIPNSVTKIGSETFYYCTGLTSINIPNSVTEIGEGAFYKCTGLTTVAIPNSVTQICNSAFSGCTGITSLEIPASLSEIEASTYEIASFSDCENIKKLVICGEENVKSLKFTDDRYDGCIPFINLQLEELYLGRIVKYTYNECKTRPSLSSIKKITFGKNLKDVGTGIYGRINQIPTTAEIYCENPVPPSLGDVKFTNTQYISNVVYVHKEALEAYKQAEGWKNFWDIRPYDFAAGIEDVYSDNTFTGIYMVYNLEGILVKKTKDKAEALDLPSGIYIINGKKVAIR